MQTSGGRVFQAERTAGAKVLGARSVFGLSEYGKGASGVGGEQRGREEVREVKGRCRTL